MASFETDPAMISYLLSRPEKLGRDEYIVAFGPDGRQFIGTPRGYAATFVPTKIMIELNGGKVKRFLYVSFGDKPGSWFFAYTTPANTVALRLGPEAPATVRDYIEVIANCRATADNDLTAFRVQFGPDGSYVHWTAREWNCHNVPAGLQDALWAVSSPRPNREPPGVPKGTIKRITWHSDGSYYLCSDDYYHCDYQGLLIKEQWAKLRGTEEIELPQELRDLACVSIDSFALKSDTFAFIKKQIGNQEAPFVLHYHQEPVYDRLPPSGIESSASSSTVEMDQLITLPGHEASKPCPRHWATSKKEGRPHKSDTWELDLKKGERVEIFRDMGNDWYVGMGPEGILGMCHHSWLTFDTEGSRDTYTLFHEHCLKILVPGKLRDFPPVKYYANTCKKGECQLLKKNQSLLGICEHDLRDLLQASGSFDRSWVKAGRNNWHPDKFARFCVPDRVEDLKPKAQEMFVLYGILIETM